MQRITIIEDVCVEASSLDERVSDHIYEKLVSKFQGHCDQKYGHVIQVCKNVRILSNVISTTSSGVFFKVRVSMDTLNPKAGGTYQGKVCMIFKEGIFVELFGKVKVLIPSGVIPEFKYNKTTSCFERSRGVSIKIGDEVEVVLDTVKYERKNFICLGSLKNTL